MTTFKIRRVLAETVAHAMDSRTFDPRPVGATEQLSIDSRGTRLRGGDVDDDEQIASWSFGWNTPIWEPEYRIERPIVSACALGPEELEKECMTNQIPRIRRNCFEGFRQPEARFVPP